MSLEGWFRTSTLRPNRTKLYRAKWAALKMNYGDVLDQYNKLWDYGAELMRANPESLFYLNRLEGCFNTLYFSFDILMLAREDS